MLDTLLTTKTPRLFTLALLASSAFCASTLPGVEPTATVHTAPADACSRADALIARPELAAYRGWLKYLEFRAKFDAETFGAESIEAKAAHERLGEWTAKIEADPAILGKLRGVQEWAYESAADGSGQPFKINIPTDYNPGKATPASLYCHGYSGNHLEHSVGWTEQQGRFDIGVLGRARGGFYMSLSEADVMDVVRYVKANWNIDDCRLSLNGGSMGGYASFWLGSRHPDVWASIRPNCGFAFTPPIDNLVTTPIYSLHSKDDPVVNIALDDGPLKHLVAIGGCVTFEEANGFGHAVWNFTEGNARASAWEKRQVRAPSNETRYIDFIAMDGKADKAWWAEVAEWGPENRPAHFILNATLDNTLYVMADNLARLNLDIANSPFDETRDLAVSVNGAIAFTVPAPLPDKVVLAKGADGWAVEKESPSLPFRLRTPGGTAMVYDGSPLLIVYGTHGTAEENAAMLAAATAASKSPNASWPMDDIDRSPVDKVSHYQNLYGNLNLKADDAVTADDIARCNLVLIGTPKGNSLAARLAGKLPATIGGDTITIADGTSLEAKGKALSLVHYNPENPGRLLLWLASTDPTFYKAGNVFPQILATAFGVDLAVMDTHSPTLVVARTFDSRWNMTPACPRQSILIPEASCDEKGMAELIASAIAKAIGADFGLGLRTFYQLNRATPALSATSGITTYGDIARMHYFMPIYTVSLSGKQLLDMMQKRDALKSHLFEISSEFDAAKIDGARIYKIAVTEDDLWAIPETGFLPDNSEWTGAYADQAILNAAGK
jgi:pimeloyl-ACP methyl ester carboxylesterase